MNYHSSRPLGLPIFLWRLLLAAAIAAVFMLTRAEAGDCACTKPASCAPALPVVFQQPPDSWVFMRSRYTHDPETGARVAQYAMKPPIEPFDDPRLVTSGYSRSRVVLRGADGSVDTTYRVQSFGNGRGGIDAEWERFHDAWRGSTIAGGNFAAYPPYGYGYGGYPGPYTGGYGAAGFGYGGAPGYGGGGFPLGNRGLGYGGGFGQPDAGRLDPDGADGYQEQQRRTPDRRFFNPGLPPFEKPQP
ncbi:MAG: hypothetical protein IT424_16000 [Pirellulales bacterium]|nr:hypothetical protein [Pirellulales bacterium]